MTAATTPSEAPRVLIVIVNYRTPALAIACLASLAEERSRVPGLRVVVADAASGDGSPEQIESALAREGWGEWVRLVALPRNGGFAYANNAVIRPALAAADPPDYIHLLNPDTLVRPGAVAALVRFLAEHPAVGIAGSGQEDAHGVPRVSAYRFPSVLGEFESGIRTGPVTRLLGRYVVAQPVRDEAHPTDWLSGASLMVRRRVFEEVGLFDEDYFLYYEELDFCLAARRKGWPCWFVPASHVVHYEGGATGVTDASPQAVRYPPYWFESRRRYFLKSGSRARALAADLALLIGFALWRLRRFVQRKPDRDPPHFLGDLFRHSTLRRGFQL